MNQQWTHEGSDTPCQNCQLFIGRVFAPLEIIPLPAHPNCHCYYMPTNADADSTAVDWSSLPTNQQAFYVRLVAYYLREELPVPPILEPLTADARKYNESKEFAHQETPLEIGGQNPYNIGGQGNRDTAVTNPTNLTRQTLNITQSPSTNQYEIVLIDAGNGNGWQFPSETLETYASQLTAVSIASFVDHERHSVAEDRPGRRTLRDYCGQIGDVMYDPDRQALVGKFTPKPPAGELATAVMQDALTDGANPAGFSVDVSFHHDGNVVTDLTTIHSCDLVYNPARGGRVVRALFSSLHPTPNQENNPMPTNDTSPEEVSSTAVDSTLPTKAQLAHHSNDAEKRAAEMLYQMSQNLLHISITASQLPPPAAERLRTHFSDKTPDMGEIEQAIEDERNYLAQIGKATGTAVQGFGAPDHDGAAPVEMQFGSKRLVVPPGSDPLDRAREALTEWFRSSEIRKGGEKLDIADAYVAFTGDTELEGKMNPSRALFNVNDTTIADIVADVMSVVIAEEWSNFDQRQYFWWKQVVREDSIDSFFDVNWTTYGGFSNLSKFTPGDAVTNIPVTDLDNNEPGTWEYPAGLVSMPLHTFDKAATRNWVRNLPIKLAQAAVGTLSADISAFFTANAGVGPVLADGDNLFDVAHDNLGTAALTTASWADAIQAMWSQVEQESGRRMALRPWGILVPIELEGLAVQILANTAEHGTADRNINPYQYAAERVIPVPEWTNVDNFAAFTRPGALGVGYRYGEVPRVVPEPGGMNSQGMFTNRHLRWKVEHFYNLGVINYRGLRKHNI